MNILDRLKAAASLLGNGKLPSEAPAPSASDYLSVKWSPRRGNIHSHQPQDHKQEMSSFDRTEMVRKSRWLDKNSGFFKQLINDMATYACGDGIFPQAQTGVSEIDDAYEDYFREFWLNPEITGRFDGVELLHIWCKAIDRDGDIFVILTRDEEGNPKIQTIEAHRIANSRSNLSCTDGVCMDNVGRIVGYNVTQDDKSDRFVPHESMCHIYEPDFVSGVRGVPSLQHAINHVQDVMELFSLEKDAAKLNAEVARILRKASGKATTEDALGLSSRPLNASSNTDPDYIQDTIGGKTVVLAPEETLESFQSNRPNPLFQGFYEALLKEAASGHIPYEFIADSGRIGGAQLRLVLAKSDRRFQMRQRALVSRSLRKIYLYVIGDGIARGILPQHEDWMKVEWQGARRVTVDAGRDANANRADIEFGLKTMTDDFAERGMVLRKEVRKRATEMVYIMEVSREYGVPFELLLKFMGGIDSFAAAPEEATEMSEGDADTTGADEKDSEKESEDNYELDD